MRKKHCYYVYIVANPKNTVLYIGVTNDLSRRLFEHTENRGNPVTFAGKYYCYNLVYWESHKYVKEAIGREKELKKWSRRKKNVLISEFNEGWLKLNLDFE